MPPTEGASASFVATGTTDNQVAILAFPSLEVVVSTFSVEGGDLVDLDWGGPQGTWVRHCETSSRQDEADTSSSWWRRRRS